MELIDQNWNFIGFIPEEKHILKLIEMAGRTCYKTEDNMTDESSTNFVKMILKNGHHSVIEHWNVTVKIVTDRGVTHEIVRHRLASYSQESTRYCNYSVNKMGIKFILPVDFELNPLDKAILKALEDHYNRSLEIGRTPQQARYFLPNGLKTEIVVTMNLREWRHFFSLRCSAKAHPQMRALAQSMLAQFKRQWPTIFGDLNS